jgi:iron(III) transport system permease protein
MRRRAGPALWLVASAAITLLVMAPLGALAVAASRGSAGLWQHLLAYVLPGATADTLVLLAGVAVMTVALGAGTAWLVTAYDFPGRATLDWALLLPLAVPTYVIAYAYLDLLHPVGPVQTAIRAVLGFDGPRDFRLPDIRSMPGCILLLGVVLYPYVYLTTRAMFLMQAANLFDVARTLGTSRGGVFLRVALPLARPAIIVGLSLALLETLNDIGASEFLGVRTLTVSIYATWITRSDLAGAAQMALAMLAVVLALVAIERRARKARRYANDAQHSRPLVPRRLRGWRAAAALGAGAAPVMFGFVAPAWYLADAALARVREFGVSPVILEEAGHTLMFASAATVLTVAAGLVVAYAARVDRGRAASALIRFASLGYAVPGTVLAIGLLPVIGWIEESAGAGLVLLGTGVAVIYAYTARFLAVAAGGIDTGFERIPPSLDDAARTLGAPAATRLWRVHLPLVRPAIATAAMLVFVDCVKELPATLLLRPLGVETLATHLYGEAVRGTYEDAALAALAIVAAGLVPVLILARISRRRGAHVPDTPGWL